MSARKKRLIFIQTMLLLAAILLLYIFYYQGNITQKPVKEVIIGNKKFEKLEESNFFEDVEYKGIDANGNRYLLQSEIATFNEELTISDLEIKPKDVEQAMEKWLWRYRDGGQFAKAK